MLYLLSDTEDEAEAGKKILKKKKKRRMVSTICELYGWWKNQKRWYINWPSVGLEQVDFERLFTF